MSEHTFATPAAIAPQVTTKLHNQRISIAVMAALGILSTFLPWAHIGVLTKTGSQGDGWITLVLFLPALLISLLGYKASSLTTVSRLMAAIPAGMAALIGIYEIVDFQSRIGEVVKDNPFGAILAVSTRIGVGLYLLVAAGVGITALTCFFLQKRKTIQKIETNTPGNNPPTYADDHTLNKWQGIGLGTWLLVLTFSIGLPATYYIAKEGNIFTAKELTDKSQLAKEENIFDAKELTDKLQLAFDQIAKLAGHGTQAFENIENLANYITEDRKQIRDMEARLKTLEARQQLLTKISSDLASGEEGNIDNLSLDSDGKLPAIIQIKIAGDGE